MGWRAGVVAVAMLVEMRALGLAGGAAPMVARKAYVDRTNGVSFSYPAGWLLNADDDAATAKLRIVSEGQPGAVVQLEGNFADDEVNPYKGTEFEAGAFAYVVVPEESETGCFEVLEGAADGRQRPIPVMVSGIPAQRLDAKFSVAGTMDTHRMMAVYRRGQCYLFETVLVTSSGGTKPLSAGRWAGIRGAFAGVMDSVRVGR